MFKYTPPPLLIGQSTDVGRRRHENQDSMGYAVLDRFAYKGAHLVICADGMGGASGGQIASSTAVEKILEYFQQGHPSPEPDIAIREAVELAAQVVQQKTDDDPRLDGMGTTCVIVLVHNGFLFAGHIGDSRLYLWRHGRLKRLTRDHSRVQFMVEAGILSEEDAKRHPHQNFLARVLGSNQPPRVELLAPPRKLELGDRILLCSDGLYNEVSDETIAKILQQLDPQPAAEKLVQLANENGGNDNITVQIFGYGPAQPKVVEESWFRFSHASHGFLFYFLCGVLFFAVGFLAGKHKHNTPCPQNTASTHTLSNRDTVPPTKPTQDRDTVPPTKPTQDRNTAQNQNVIPPVVVRETTRDVVPPVVVRETTTRDVVPPVVVRETTTRDVVPPVVVRETTVRDVIPPVKTRDIQVPVQLQPIPTTPTTRSTATTGTLPHSTPTSRPAAASRPTTPGPTPARPQTR